MADAAIAMYYLFTLLTGLASVGSAWVQYRRDTDDGQGPAVFAACTGLLFCVELVGVWNLAAQPFPSLH